MLRIWRDITYFILTIELNIECRRTVVFRSTVIKNNQVREKNVVPFSGIIN